jgi:hypothetical protein
MQSSGQAFQPDLRGDPHPIFFTPPAAVVEWDAVSVLRQVSLWVSVGV